MNGKPNERHRAVQAKVKPPVSSPANRRQKTLDQKILSLYLRLLDEEERRITEVLKGVAV